jgi:vacuolar-type H+-ATPase subunit H
MAQASLLRIKDAENEAAQRLKAANQEAADRRKMAEMASRELSKRMASDTDAAIHSILTEVEQAVREEIKPFLEEGHQRVRKIQNLDTQKIEAAVLWVVGRIVT